MGAGAGNCTRVAAWVVWHPAGEPGLQLLAHVALVFTSCPPHDRLVALRRYRLRHAATQARRGYRQAGRELTRRVPEKPDFTRRQ